MSFQRALWAWLLVSILAPWACPTFGSGQPLANAPIASPAPSLVRWQAVYVAASAADLATTGLVLTHPLGDGYERNPIARIVQARTGVGGMLAAGAAFDVATGWTIGRVWGRRHPRIARAVLIGGAAFRGSLAWHNYQVYRNQQRAWKERQR